MAVPEQDNTQAEREEIPAPAKPFRFKNKFKSRTSATRTSSRSRSRSPSSASQSYRHRHDRRRHHHARHHRSKSSPARSPPPDMDIAFQQSLFDALGDDEGAAFWEGVYGQPIHNYPDTKIGPEGELERMTDEEYTAYVRRRMWEKSMEGVEDERKARLKEKREREKVETEEERPRANHKGFSNSADGRNRSVFDIEVEDSLRRGERRKRDRVWKESWEKYLNTWNELNDLVEELKTALASSTNNGATASDSASNPQVHLRNKIAWPVDSGKSKDITPEEVERFFRKTSSSSAGDDDPSMKLMRSLKTERVRWHPDKIQQRYGPFLLIDEGTLHAVVAVFQMVDALWNKERERL